MSKELPFFKWYPEKYITGDITLCSFEAQGIFANLCSFYWAKKCIISLANAKQRYNKHLASFEELLSKDIIKLDDNENLIIEFLDEQMSEFINISEKRAKAGRSGGLAKAKQMLSKSVAKSIYKEEDKNKKKIKKIPDKNQIDFIDEIIMLFQQCYYESRKVAYEITNKGKERSAAGKLINIYKKKYPDEDSKKTLQGMKVYFELCLSIKNTWLYNNMSLSIIINKFNEINQTLKNEQTTKKGVTDQQLAEILLRNFGDTGGTS